MNPGGFDYEGWLYRKGITATASVKAAQRCEDPAWMPVLKARQALTERLQHWLGDHPSRAMIAALTVGDDSGFFRCRVGSVSSHRHQSPGGDFRFSNVAIIAGFVFLLVRWSWPLSSALTKPLAGAESSDGRGGDGGLVVRHARRLGFARAARGP